MTHVELEREAGAADLEACFRKDDIFRLPAAGDAGIVSPVTVAGKDRIFVGQLKKDPFIAKGFWVWAVADNLTVGSALNAYGIARVLFGDS